MCVPRCWPCCCRFSRPSRCSLPGQAGQTVVSLEFDRRQRQASTPSPTKGPFSRMAPPPTFFVKSGTLGNSGNMTWTQVQALASAGNDIGGKTVDSANLTTDPNPTAQVCNDRQALSSTASPPLPSPTPAAPTTQPSRRSSRTAGTATRAARAACPAAGPTYADTVPPANLLAAKASTPARRRQRGDPAASDMPGRGQRCSRARRKVGTVVLYRVCSQTYGPNNYTSCLGYYVPVELEHGQRVPGASDRQTPGPAEPRRRPALSTVRQRHHRRRHHGPGNDHRLQRARPARDQHLRGSVCW